MTAKIPFRDPCFAAEVVKITYPKRGHVVKLEPMKFIPHSGRAK